MLDKYIRYINLRLSNLSYTSINYPLLQKVCIPDCTKNYKVTCNLQFSLYPVGVDYLDIIHHYILHSNVYTKVDEMMSKL